MRIKDRWRGKLTRNWYSAWLPNSEAANKKPVFRTQMEVHGGMVSKYFIRSSCHHIPFVCQCDLVQVSILALQRTERLTAQSMDKDVGRACCV